jgi:hypothetical protein
MGQKYRSTVASVDKVRPSHSILMPRSSSAFWACWVSYLASLFDDGRKVGAVGGESEEAVDYLLRDKTDEGDHGWRIISGLPLVLSISDAGWEVLDDEFWG